MSTNPSAEGWVCCWGLSDEALPGELPSSGQAIQEMIREHNHENGCGAPKADDNWRLLPRMGKRKRQILRALGAERYFWNLILEPGSTHKKAGFERISHLTALTPEKILASIAEQEEKRFMPQFVTPLDGMLLTVASDEIRSNIKGIILKNDLLFVYPSDPFAYLLKLQYKLDDHLGLITQRGEAELDIYITEKLLPLKNSNEFHKRWGSLRRSCYAALKALEEQKYIYRERVPQPKKPGLRTVIELTEEGINMLELAKTGEVIYLH